MRRIRKCRWLAVVASVALSVPVWKASSVLLIRLWSKLLFDLLGVDIIDPDRHAVSVFFAGIDVINYGLSPALTGLTAVSAYCYLWRPWLPSHCGACGYDLTGNVSGVCPECGEPTAGAGD